MIVKNKEKKTLVFILTICYNYPSCMGSRFPTEVMPGCENQWRLSSFRQTPFLYLFLLQIKPVLPSYIFFITCVL